MRSKNLIIASVLLILCIFLLAGCRAISNRYETIEIETSSSDDVEALYGYQLNFSKGTATLNIIPETMVREFRIRKENKNEVICSVGFARESCRA